MKRGHNFPYPKVTEILLVNAVIIIMIVITKAVPIMSQKDDKEVLKKYQDSCEIRISQVHCNDDEADDEDYSTGIEQEDCIPNKYDTCDKSLELYCINGICEPNCHPELEIYDIGLGKCFRKVGSSCLGGSGCGINAICLKNKCQCDRNHTVDKITGKCIGKAEYGEFCSAQINCDKTADIKCNGDISRCECKSADTQFYSQKRKKCIIYVGQPCTGLKFCPDNSDCVRTQGRSDASKTIQSFENGGIEEVEEEVYIGIPLDEYGDGLDFQCKCGKGYGSTNDGKSCLGLFGKSCASARSKCHVGLGFKCYNGTCGCAKPLKQVYDESARKCRGILGAECNSADSLSCMEGAVCKPKKNQKPDKPSGEGGIEENAVEICQCDIGLMETPEGTCLKDHGQDCSSVSYMRLIDIDNGVNGMIPNSPETVNQQLACNIFIGLECSDYGMDRGRKTCQCKDSNQFYDGKLQVCRNFEVATRNGQDQDSEHVDISDREYTFTLGRSSSSSVTITEALTGFGYYSSLLFLFSILLLHIAF